MKKSKLMGLKGLFSPSPNKKVKYSIGETITIETDLKDAFNFSMDGIEAIEGTIIKNTGADRLILHKSGVTGSFNVGNHQYQFEVPEYQMDLGVGQWIGDIIKRVVSLSPGDFEIVITNKTKIK